MPKFTLTLFSDEWPVPTARREVQARNDADAIKQGRIWVVAEAIVRGNARHPTVSIARAVANDASPEWLGAWSFDNGPNWLAEA